MDEKYIKEVFSDAAFAKSLLELEEPWEVQNALREKGIEMSESDVLRLREELLVLLEKVSESDELSLEQLEEASGGILFVAVSGATVATGVWIGSHVLAGTLLAGVMAGSVAAAGAGTAVLLGGATALLNSITGRRW